MLSLSQDYCVLCPVCVMVLSLTISFGLGFSRLLGGSCSSEMPPTDLCVCMCVCVSGRVPYRRVEAGTGTGLELGGVCVCVKRGRGTRCAR